MLDVLLDELLLPRVRPQRLLNGVSALVQVRARWQGHEHENSANDLKFIGVFALGGIRLLRGLIDVCLDHLRFLFSPISIKNYKDACCF